MSEFAPLRAALEQMGYGTQLESSMSGLRMMQAAASFQQDIEATPTGVLTADQLQALYARHAAMKQMIGTMQQPNR